MSRTHSGSRIWASARGAVAPQVRGGVEGDAADSFNLGDFDAEPQHIRRRAVFEAAQSKGDVGADMAAGVELRAVRAQLAESFGQGQRRAVVGPVPERFRRQRGDVGGLVAEGGKEQRLALGRVQAGDRFDGLQPVLGLLGIEFRADLVGGHGWHSLKNKG